MEELYKKIGEFVSSQDEVEKVCYLGKEMGYNFIIFLKNGSEAVLSIITDNKI